jgi:hypothetical protein
MDFALDQCPQLTWQALVNAQMAQVSPHLQQVLKRLLSADAAMGT